MTDFGLPIFQQLFLLHESGPAKTAPTLSKAEEQVPAIPPGIQHAMDEIKTVSNEATALSLCAKFLGSSDKSTRDLLRGGG